MPRTRSITIAAEFDVLHSTPERCACPSYITVDTTINLFQTPVGLENR